MADKKPLHKHEHPLYQWLALFIAVIGILALAGWYVVTDDAVSQDESLVGSQRSYVASSSRQTSGGSQDVATDLIDREIDGINKDIDSVSTDDLSDTKLDDTTLGL